jgi:transposase InsO family protein
MDPKKIIRRLKENAGRIRKTARELGIAPGTVIFWRERAKKVHLKYLERRSTRRHDTQERSLTTYQEQRLLALRRKTGFGAEKLKYLLKYKTHWMTVHRILKEASLVKYQPSYRRPHLQPTKHMHVKNALTPGKLQMDVKHVTPQLSGLPHTCYLYAAIDIFSRYKVGVFLPKLDQQHAIVALQHFLPILPFEPDFIQTDNGLEFQSDFDEFVQGLGWHHHYHHKSAPNENGAIERSFRTDEEEFFFFRYRRAKNLSDLNLQYQLYMHEYNTERPHLSLEMKTPKEKLQSVQKES